MPDESVLAEEKPCRCDSGAACAPAVCAAASFADGVWKCPRKEPFPVLIVKDVEIDEETDYCSGCGKPLFEGGDVTYREEYMATIVGGVVYYVGDSVSSVAL